MTGDLRERERFTLKTIAETLNQSSELKPMLQSVLEKLLEVTGLATGWIYLVKEKPHYFPVALHHLPPALSRENQKPMCEGGCWCLERFWDGRLKQAVNIIECKRLEDAVQYNWGDTRGITHHATVPLTAGAERIGLLNVASPGKELFSEDELALLQSVAYQIGTAVKKTWLFQAQQKRAEHYSKLDEVTRMIWQARDVEKLPEEVMGRIGYFFGWPYLSCWIKSGDQLQLRSLFADGKLTAPGVSAPADRLGEISAALSDHRGAFGGRVARLLRHWMPECAVVGAASLYTEKKKIGGVLAFGHTRAEDVDETDFQILKAVAYHLSLAVESARVDERRQQIRVSEERNRLARDLHDSVNQKLFSLSLTARGLGEVLPEEEGLIRDSLLDIQTLSQDALREMHSLIWQLRPSGLEEGLVTALKNYGKDLELDVSEEVKGVGNLPPGVEEALWRIGQEALNNVSKHARTRRVTISLELKEQVVRMEVIDDGCGFADRKTNRRSLGITGMMERVELLGGSLELASRPGKGTAVRVFFSMDGRRSGDADSRSVSG
ncbi:GAF domain-containing sensor histidine kinase [Paludifilum halophilum]|uniref:histidine kinase n=1 Tax=Paludifilum halophilum TaxID=1642702 RepID=A0A235B4L4_9BACL|nr:GAF domain-containing sensor histidine kinase [Paludifilum halophilum]OYD07223.1 hypothetical protein CHM34_12630 [Paludifilum halophilum]